MQSGYPDAPQPTSPACRSSSAVLTQPQTTSAGRDGTDEKGTAAESTSAARSAEEMSNQVSTIVALAERGEFEAIHELTKASKKPQSDAVTAEVAAPTQTFPPTPQVGDYISLLNSGTVLTVNTQPTEAPGLPSANIQAASVSGSSSTKNQPAAAPRPPSTNGQPAAVPGPTIATTQPAAVTGRQNLSAPVVLDGGNGRYSRFYTHAMRRS